MTADDVLNELKLAAHNIVSGNRLGTAADAAKFANLWLQSCAAPEAGRTAWISVKDRLPTEENEMCVIGNDEIAWGVYPWKLDTKGDGAGWLDLFEGVLYRPVDVTHWMPLPPLPQPHTPSTNGETP